MFVIPEKYHKCVENLEKDAVPADMLFHYTTWAGLTGILNKQELWLTHYSQLNDTSEILYARDVIRDFIFTLVPNVSRHVFWEPLFEGFLQELIEDKFDFFFGSFCMKKNYLYAWRAYADDGAGFSVGFKKEFFNGKFLGYEEQAGAPSFGRGKIYYDYKLLEEDIRNLVEITQKDLENRNALGSTEESASKRFEIAMYFTFTLLPFLNSIKHGAYEEEHEHRIYASMLKSDPQQTFYSPGIDASKPHLNSKKRVYFRFDLEQITEIWVGPKLNFEHAKHDIEKILRSLKNDGKKVGEIKIIPSGIPYKNR